MTSRRRIAASLAALVALSGALVLGGVTAAQAAPELDFAAGLDGSAQSTTTSGFVLSGTTDSLAQVLVYDSSESLVCTATPPGDGTWACPPIHLPLGSHSYNAAQQDPVTDPPANASATFSLQPGPPDYDQPNPYVVAQDSTAFFSGATTAPGADIRVVIDGVTPFCEQNDIATPGPWSCSIPLAGVAPGTYTMRVQQNVDGYFGEGSGPLVIQAPTPFALTSPAAEQEFVWDADDTFAVSGTAPDELPIAVYLDDELLCTATPADTAWSCDDLPYPAPGSRVIDAYRGEEQHSASFDVLLPAPAVDDTWPSTVLVGTPSIAFTGSVTYPGASTRSTLYEGYSEGMSSDPLPGTSCTTDAGTFECAAEIGELPTGYYTMVFRHFLPLEPEVAGVTTEIVFQIVEGEDPPPPGETPVLGCVFQPGSFEVTDDAGYDVSLYTLVEGGEGYTLAPPALCGTNAGNQFAPGTSFDDTFYAGDWTALPPGLYEAWVNSDGEGGEGEGEGEGEGGGTYDFVFTIPETPSITSVTSTGTTVTLQGSGTPGNDLRVDDPAGNPLCSTTVDEGDWTCTFAKSTASEARATDIDAESRGMSAYSDAVTIPIQGTPSTSTIRCEFTPAGLVVTTTDPNVMLQYQPVVPNDGGSVETFGTCSGRGGVEPSSVPGYGPATECSPTCDLTGLAPGLHSLWFMRSDADETGGAGSDVPGYEPFQYFFVVPEAPQISTVAAPASTVTVTGTSTGGDTVRVVDGDGATLCSAVVQDGGSWACSFARTAATTVRALAIDASSGGMSAYSAARAIPAAPPAPTPDPEPTPSPTPTPVPSTTPTPVATPTPIPTLAAPERWTVTITGDLLNLRPGDTFSVTIGGMALGWGAEVVMHSTPRVLGTAEATGGPVTLDLTVPDDIESGPHRIEVVAVTPIGTRYFENFDARVTGGVDVVNEAEDPATDEPGDGAGGSGGSGAVDRTDPGAPSGITGTLAPLSVIAANPAAIAIAGGLALALLFLVALPTELLNSSLSSNTSRLGRAYGTVDGAMTKAKDWFIGVTRSRALAAAVITVLVAIVYGFVDPGFGFDIVSLRLVLSLAIAFFLLSYVASWISGMIIRRAWGAIGVVEIQPSIILFAIVGVIVARILEFSPGFLVGLAIGLELLQASRKVSARAIFVQIGVVTGLALAAWVVYSFFTPGNDFLGMLVEDTLVATTAEGLTGALIAIVPLKFLDGHDLWAVSKRLWIASFLIVAVAFSLLVLPTAINGTDVADYGTWLLVFAAFGLVSVLIWLIFVRADAKAAKAEGEKVDA